MKNTKPLGRKSYGSIPHVSFSRRDSEDGFISEGQESIIFKKCRDWRDLIIIQEKLDGSNCSVAKKEGEIIALGRSGYLAKTSPFEMHHMFSGWVNENAYRFNGMLEEGERVCGEWLAVAHGTIYKLKHEPFVIFDKFTCDNKRMLYLDLVKLCSKANFHTPHLLHIGQSIPSKQIIKVLNGISSIHHYNNDEKEGFVMRCERNGSVDFLAKYVNADKIDGKYLGGIEDVYNIFHGNNQ